MAISRMQMNRQLYAGGGIMEVAPRSKFGLGSSLKKFVRKVIPNEISEIAVKAAPFVAPFNPLLAGAMSGIGSFDQTGSISSGLKRGLLTYGGGQAARYLGGAGFQQGINPFAGADFSGGIMSGIRSLGSSPFGTETGLKLGQYEMFGGPGKETFQAQQEAAKAAIPQDLDSYGSIEEYLQATGQTEKIPLQLRTEMVAKDLATKAAPTDYGQLFKSAVSPESTFGERTEALKQLGGKALKTMYTDKEGNIDKLAVAATIAGGANYIDAKRLATEAGVVDNPEEYTEEMYNADKQKYSDYYSQILTPAAFGLKKGGRVNFSTGSVPGGVPSIMLKEKNEDESKEDKINRLIEEGYSIDEAIKMVTPEAKSSVEFSREELNLPPLTEEEKGMQEDIDDIEPGLLEYMRSKEADGGRIGFFEGSPDDPQGRRKGIVSINPMQEDLEEVGIGTMAASPFTAAEKTFLFKFLAGKGGKERTITMPDLYKIFKNPGKYPKDEQILKGVIEMKMGKKEGGRIGFMMGSEVPVRQNQAGVSEMDYRNTGGFVPPIGVKEKADDIPAMLSNNEFVFTADAVRAAGGGSVNKGAQKMYNLMKQLEGKLV